MNISVLDSLSAVPSASAAAVVGFVPTNTASVDGPGCQDKDLHPDRADAVVHDLVRVTDGPIVLIVTHNDDAWADSFKRHGLHTTKGMYVFDTIGIVAGSRGPIQLPKGEFFNVGTLVQALTVRVSNPGATVVVPYAYDLVTTLAIARMNRETIAVAQSATHAAYLQTTLAGKAYSPALTDEQYDEVLHRLDQGQSASAIARSLGVVYHRLCERLDRDGVRPYRVPRKQRAEATA